MKTSFVAMGEYYRSNTIGLVKTVCRGFNNKTGEAMVAYVNVNPGGFASEIYFMSEADFKTAFMF